MKWVLIDAEGEQLLDVSDEEDEVDAYAEFMNYLLDEKFDDGHTFYVVDLSKQQLVMLKNEPALMPCPPD